MASFDTSDRTCLFPEHANPKRTRSVTSTFFGYCKTRLRGREEYIQLLPFVLSIVALLAYIVLTILKMHGLHDPYSAKFTLGVLLVINAVFCIIFAIFGVFFHHIAGLPVIFVSFLTTGVIFSIDEFQTKNLDWNFWVRVACLCLVIIGFVWIVCYNCMHLEKIPNYAGYTRKPDQKKVIWDNIFRSVLILDLQISLTMIPIVWPEGIHFNQVDRTLMIPTGIASGVMFFTGLIVVLIKEKLTRRCRLTLYCIYSLCWFSILLYAVFLMCETFKDLKENTNSTKAIDGIYYIAMMESSLSLLLKAATLVLGIIGCRSIGHGANTADNSNTINAQEASSNIAQPNEENGGLESSVC